MESFNLCLLVSGITSIIIISIAWLRNYECFDEKHIKKLEEKYGKEIDKRKATKFEYISRYIIDIFFIVLAILIDDSVTCLISVIVLSGICIIIYTLLRKFYIVKS